MWTLWISLLLQRLSAGALGAAQAVCTDRHSTRLAEPEASTVPPHPDEGPAIRRIRLSQPAPTERFLTVPLRIQTPSGEEVLVQAMLDTGSEIDAIHSRLVEKLQGFGVHIESGSASELQVVGGGTTRTHGSALLDCQ